MQETPWEYCLLSFLFQPTTAKQNRRRRDVEKKMEGQAKDVCSFSVQYFLPSHWKSELKPKAWLTLREF